MSATAGPLRPGEPEPGGPARVRLAVDPGDVAAALAIRHQVFVQEQGVPVELERDPRDRDADHFLALVAGVPAGAARLVIEPAGFEGLDLRLGPVAHLGRLAVLSSARRQGLGALLVGAVQGRAVDRGLAVVYLGAQTHAVGFYATLGYGAFGADFLDAGLEHRHMAHVL